MGTFTVPDDLTQRIEAEARRLGKLPEERILEILEGAVAPAENFEPGHLEEGFVKLRSFVERIPCVAYVSASKPSEPMWWLKFHIDICSPIAWHAVQSLGFVLNYLSIEERLPTVFMPVSPPPYLNGGPDEYLSWVIEASIPFLDAGYIADVLKGRLPDPVAEEGSWLQEDAA